MTHEMCYVSVMTHRREKIERSQSAQRKVVTPSDPKIIIQSRDIEHRKVMTHCRVKKMTHSKSDQTNITRRTYKVVHSLLCTYRAVVSHSPSTLRFSLEPIYVYSNPLRNYQ